MHILYFKQLADTESVVTDNLGVYLVIDNLMYVPSDALPMYQIFKQSDNWLYGYIAFKRFGDTESVITNAVILGK